MTRHPISSNRYLVLAAVVAGLLLVEGCGGATDSLSVAASANETGFAPTDATVTASLPPFEGRYVAGTWASATPSLVETTWVIDYDGAHRWSKHAIETDSPVTPLTRVTLHDGTLETAVIDPQVRASSDPRTQDADAAVNRESVDGPVLPEPWMHPFDVAALQARPNWTVTELPDGGWRLVEVLQIGCEPETKEDGPSVFQCQPGAASITDSTTYLLDAQGIPRSVEVRYDGELVGFARTESIELSAK